MQERYNVYFAGQIIAGHDENGVREKMARLFNADENTLDKLFSGKAQLIKRNCDDATASKYKTAMERAGAQPIIKAVEQQAEASKTGPKPSQSAAQKIAALAAASDEGHYRNPAQKTPKSHEQEQQTPDAGEIVLAPPGTEVLRENERARPAVREVDTSSLQVDTSAQRLSEEPPPPPAAPDTDHLSMGNVGEAIPNLPSSENPVSPTVDHLELSVPGSDFSDCAKDTLQPVAPDVSGLELDPPGSTLLDEKFRKQGQGTAPSTDHLSLDD